MTEASMGSQPSAAQESRWRSSVRALRHRNYRLFFLGQLVSLIGTWMQNIAQSWLVYRLTGSSLLLGSIGFASQIPVLLFSMVGGAVADRYNRHRIVLATQCLSMVLAFVLAGLTLTHHVQVWHLFVLSSLLGVVNAFDIPARQALVVEMVGQRDLINAVALNSSVFNGARVVGPALAGALVASLGEGWCFFGNGVSFAAVIGGLLLMRFERAAGEVRRQSATEGLLEGLAFVRDTPPVRAILLLLGLVSLVGLPYAVLMPIFADRILHAGARGLGLLMGATGIGALAGALTLAARRGLKGLGRWLAMAAAGFGLSLIAFSQSRVMWLSLAILPIVGFSLIIQMASCNTLVQSMVPDRLRGRVMAVYSMMFLGMAPFGALMGGALAARLGAPLTLSLGGAASVIGAAVFAKKLPSLRVQARELILMQSSEHGD